MSASLPEAARDRPATHGAVEETSEPQIQESAARAEAAHVPFTDALLEALPPFAVSRLLLLGVTVSIVLVLRRSPFELWSQWDGKWYLGIATHGYHWSLDGKPPLAFFPLYPLLVHLGSVVGLPEVAAALVVSNVAFLAALAYLYHLTALEWGAVAARRASWIIALFPTAFFTFAPYTEALWLLCAGGALFHARKGQAAPAGLWVAAGILTRSTGIILLLPALMALGSKRQRAWPLVVIPSLCTLVVYGLYLTSQHLSLLEVIHAQRAWHRALTYPWTGFATSVDWLINHGTQNMLFGVEDVLQLTAAVLFLALTLVAWHRCDKVTAAYCAGFWLVVLSSPAWLDRFYAPFNSMDRFVLALFPLAGWAASCVSPPQYRVWITVSAVLMLGASAVHLCGGWVG